MFDWLTDILDTADYPARWNCGSWDSSLGWTHIVADLVIFAAYVAIPTIIAIFLRRRRDLPFPGVAWWFVAFIFSCGLTHLIEAVIFYEPVYRLAAVVKVITALASVGTAIVLVKVTPRMLALPERAREADALERSNRELEQFAFVASHDLKAPVRKILGFAQVLGAEYTQRGEAPPASLDRIESAANDMESMIEGLLDMARVDQDLDPPQAVSITKLVDAWYEDHSPEFDRRGGAWEVGALPPAAGPPHQIAQVIRNLLDNALKYSPVELAISIEGHIRDGRAQYTIQDRGIGIPAEKRDEVFLLFQRLHGKSSYEGAGIGLSIVRRVVERLGGRITLGETPRGGTRVSFDLPQGSEEALPAPAVATMPRPRTPIVTPAPPEGSTTDAEVIIIDDDDEVVQLTTILIQQSLPKLRIAAFTNPVNAVEDLIASAPRRRLVLVDLNMQPMDGFGVLGHLQAPSRLGADLHVVILTASSDPNDRKRSLAGGAEAVWRKPIEPEAIAWITDWLKRDDT